jgi:ATP-dependent RNA helicase RhlE
MPFASLGLDPALAQAAAEQGYTAPTPIQADVVPAVLAGRDVQAQAPTGSGKTAAFALALLQQLHTAPASTPRRAGALVLVPTRELAVQVGEVFTVLAQHLEPVLKVSTVFGGVSINPQMMALRGGTDLLVATPGRLLDLVQHNAVRLGGVRALVLDEADRLLDSGFAEELRAALALLPRARQNLLFSATFPPAVQALAQAMLKDPVRLTQAAEPAADPAIEQHAVQVDTARRTALLQHMIRSGGWTRTLVFVATRHATEHVANKLRTRGIASAALHGELSQGARTQALADFKNGRLQVLVATDLAARGLDIVELPVVVNYDLARSPADHVHRIGRTGRAGARGLAVSFISTATEAHFRVIEKRQGQRVPREQIAGFEPTEDAPSESAESSSGGVKGRRKSKKDKLREAAAAPTTRRS